MACSRAGWHGEGLIEALGLWRYGRWVLSVALCEGGRWFLMNIYDLAGLVGTNARYVFCFFSQYSVVRVGVMAIVYLWVLHIFV